MMPSVRALAVVLVSRVRGNPYVPLLRESLEQAAPGIRASVSDQFSLKWVWRHRRDVDVLHLHWLDILVAYPTWAWSLKRAATVTLGLLVAKLAGIRLVYTVHNLDHHEGRRAWLVSLVHRVAFRIVDAVHVHDGDTAQVLATEWRRRRAVFVIPHASYVGAYRDDVERADARHKLGMPDDAFVYLFLGRLRPYKGIEELVSSFRTLYHADARLLIAGQAQEPDYVDAVRALAESDERIIVRPEYVADEDIQLYMRACDLCVLPYRHVTTSGAALLAFSFQTPIIAPRLGCFRELLGADARGVGYDPADENGLTRALAVARALDLPKAREACLAYIEPLSWLNIARQHAAVYHTVIRKTDE